MTNATHTPGPWRISPERQPVRSHARMIRAQYNDLIADVYGVSNPLDESADANARLIAEAPAMLDALRAIISSGRGTKAGIQAIDSAIAILRRIEEAS